MYNHVFFIEINLLATCVGHILSNASLLSWPSVRTATTFTCWGYVAAYWLESVICHTSGLVREKIVLLSSINIAIFAYSLAI